MARFDEIHKLNKETYFKEMGLSDGQTQSREELADMLIDFFMMYMDEIEDMVENDTPVDEFKVKMAEKLNQALNTYGFNFNRYMELETYSNQLIDEITDTTLEKIKTPFFTSKERAELIALDHTNSLYNYVDYTDAKRRGFKYKQWVTVIDDTTRPWHHDADGQKVKIDEMFDVGGEQMRFPHDPNASLRNISRCRCICLYT